MINRNLFSGVQQSIELASSLPPEVFTSPQWFEFEKENIIKNSWNFVGLEQTVSEVGAYFVVELFGESIIVIRGHDGVVRALINVCRHRSSRMLKGSGSCKVIQCPFHAWSYRLDGRLAAAPGFNIFDDAMKDEYRLHELRLESWQGLIFVTFSEEAPSIQDCLSSIPGDINLYPLESMLCVREHVDRVRVNWKLYNDIDTDPGHGPVHRTSIGAQSFDLLTKSKYARSLFMKSNYSSALLPRDRNRGFEHISGLPGRAAEGTLYLQFFPGLYVIMAQDCAWWLNKTPVDHETTILRVGYMFPNETVARHDFEDRLPIYFDRWDQVVHEDNWIMELQQQGMSSDYSRSGPFSKLDGYVWDLHNWYAERVLEACDERRGEWLEMPAS